MNEPVRVESTMGLRCNYCSAPLKQPEAGSDYTKCESCGQTVKLVDAKTFLDQILLQVNGWIRSTIPSGFDFSHAENADVIARYNIFVNNIKPKLTAEFRDYRFNLFNLLSNPLMVLPFKCSMPINIKNTSKQVFEFSAKNNKILPLAVDDESKALVSEVDRYATTYAYLLNNAALMQKKQPERYALMAENFQQSYQLMKEDMTAKPLAHRVLGLSFMATGTDLMLKGKLSEAGEAFRASIENLETAKKGVIGNSNFGIMYQAIDKEIVLIKSLESMLQTAEMDYGGDPLGTFASYQRIIEISCMLESTRLPRWAPVFRDEARTKEILEWTMSVRDAQKGTSTIDVLIGNGNVLFPFWEVDFHYSFKTGALWKKKGVEVTEVILVSASFTTDETLLCNPRLALTDVFANFQGSGTLNSLRGLETTISNSGSLKMVSNMVNKQSVAGRYVITPLSTRKEVTMLMEDYVARLSIGDEKFRLSAPQIKRMIFIPGEINQSGIPSMNYNFGGIPPRNIGRIDIMTRAIM